MDKKEIAKIRRWFGYDLKEMGAKIGAHFTTVCLMEAGKRQPTESQLKRLEVLKRRVAAEMRREVLAMEPVGPQHD